MLKSICRGIAVAALWCVIVDGYAADNARLTAPFQMESEGVAAIAVRQQDDANQYQVRFDGKALSIVKLENGASQTLGSRALPGGASYSKDARWVLSAVASGNMIRGFVTDHNGAEVTSGTVFDRTFETGGLSLVETDAVTWGEPAAQELPQHITHPADLAGSYDVIVAGAGTAGSMAAVQAARMGASVLVVEESDWIGGQMAAAAVSSMDEGGENPAYGFDRNSVRERGLYREFFHDAVHLYDTMGLSTDTCYVTENHFGVEPRTAQALLYEMFQAERMAGRTLDVTTETSISEVLKSGNTVTGVKLLITTTGGDFEQQVASKILIDATEYGDILPLAGVPYRVGNWTSDSIDMQADEFPPVQDYTWTAVITAYPDGIPDNMKMTVPPPGYNKDDLRLALDNPRPERAVNPWSWQRFLAYRGMPDSDRRDSTIINPWAAVTKTHMNIGGNDAHVHAGHIENLDLRQEMEYNSKLSTLRLLYYIQNDMTEPVTTWTVAMNEGFDTTFNSRQNERLIARYPDLAPYRDILNQMPPIPYARESRRMIGVHTMTAREVDRRTGPLVFPTSVAVGDYAVDLHGADSPSELEAGLDNPEDLGAIGFAGNQLGPFTIPFEAFIPETMDGFLPTEKNISQSRLVSGATRLQPSTMLMGQAAGAIAGLAISKSVNPRDLHPAEVQKVLLDGGSSIYAERFDIHKLNGVPQYTELWESLQLCLLYGVVHLADAHAHLGGFKILYGGIGDNGWHIGDGGNLRFAGEATGLAVCEGIVDPDYQVWTKLSRTSGPGAVGLVARLTDAGNYYHARLYGQSLQLYKWEDNRPALLTSGTVAYKDGTWVKMALQVHDDQLTASLYDEADNVLSQVSITDVTHTTGTGGLRVQPGKGHAAQFDEFTVNEGLPNGDTTFVARFGKPVNFATDDLTHGRLKTFLARYLGVDEKFIDYGAFDDEKPVTRGELAVAVVDALKLPAGGNAAPRDFADVPADHAAYKQVQALAAQLSGGTPFLRDAGQFGPDRTVSLGDTLHLFADLLVNPPAGAENVASDRRAARPIQ